MRVLLTGATGFIGSHLLPAIVREGHHVVALKRANSNTPDRLTQERITWITIEENLKEQLAELGRFDAVLHLATNYVREGGALLEVERANVEFPLTLLEFSINGGCDFFINTDTFFSREKYRYSYMREYIVTKQNFLKWGIVAAESNLGFCFVNARLEHVYGPGDGGGKFIPSIIRDLLANKLEISLTGCEQRRDFIYVTDVVMAYLKILSNKEILNGFIELEVGSGRSIALKELVILAKKITDSKSVLKFGELKQRVGEIMESHADICSLRSMGWESQINLEEGLMLVVGEVISN